MYQLESFYGMKAYAAWKSSQPSDLRPFRCVSDPKSPFETSNYKTLSQRGKPLARYDIRRYSDLVDAVSFLTVMNKRLTLLFRGQTSDLEPVPRLFRPVWHFTDKHKNKHKFDIPASARGSYWKALADISRKAISICEEFGLPRYRDLSVIRELPWAVIQHYGLWPTPLIDLTSSLRIAATFALPPPAKSHRTGFLFVAGFPAPSGSVLIVLG
jgi:hypothetical protein